LSLRRVSVGRLSKRNAPHDGKSTTYIDAARIVEPSGLPARP